MREKTAAGSAGRAEPAAEYFYREMLSDAMTRQSLPEKATP